MLCKSFPAAACEAVSTELAAIVKDAANLCNHFCSNMAVVAIERVQELVMYDSIAGAEIVEDSADVTGHHPGSKGPPPRRRPGEESHDFTSPYVQKLRALHQELTDICWSLNHEQIVVVSNFEFCPREYFSEKLAEFFSGTIRQYIGRGQPPRPTVLLNKVGRLAHAGSVARYLCGGKRCATRRSRARGAPSADLVVLRAGGLG